MKLYIILAIVLGLVGSTAYQTWQLKRVRVENAALIETQNALINTVKVNAETIIRLEKDKALSDELYEKLKNTEEESKRNTKAMIKIIEEMSAKDPINKRKISPVIAHVINSIKEGEK